MMDELDIKDTAGHGTHVCTSICGNGLQNGDIRVRGVALGATLMVQFIAQFSKDPNKGAIEVPMDLSLHLFSNPYSLGYRIHRYKGQAWDIDKFLIEHQDFVVLVAVGNTADKTKSKSNHIGAAGSAFNCITVGATGTTRPNDDYSFGSEVDAKPMTRINDTAKFSSRGTTKPGRDINGSEYDGRIKPDVVALGVAILSAAPRAMVKDSRNRVKYRRSGDNDWTFMSGTSISTPLGAGCVAFLREALQEHGKRYPSAALVKALLVNGAVNFSEQLGLGLGYDYDQGFERVDIDSLISMVKLSSFIDGGKLFEDTQFDVAPLRKVTEEERQWSSSPIPVPAGRNRLTVTLTSPDRPAQSGLMQNDINLIILSGEAERHGNMSKSSGFDHITNLALNNVKKIIWENVPGDTFKIVVSIWTNIDVKAPTSFGVWDIRPLARL
ncbi:peptidase S8/S53 domain-containing protein [Fusarium venenatum]|uniref:peptidase S8/S53 domain-containing protein n=1 Tax=Fusarium venenatum TaxID=56646 RepID=UPI001DA6FC25|nr:peptidase S8/S53 domain-containing protein [Fusarium venenatum]